MTNHLADIGAMAQEAMRDGWQRASTTPVNVTCCRLCSTPLFVWESHICRNCAVADTTRLPAVLVPHVDGTRGLLTEIRVDRLASLSRSLGVRYANG